MKTFLINTAQNEFLANNITLVHINDLFPELPNVIAANAGQQLLRNQKTMFTVPFVKRSESKSLNQTSASSKYSKEKTEKIILGPRKKYEAIFDLNVTTYKPVKNTQLKLFFLNFRNFSKELKNTDTSQTFDKTLNLFEEGKGGESLGPYQAQAEENVLPTCPEEQLSNREQKCKYIQTNLRQTNLDNERRNDGKIDDSLQTPNFIENPTPGETEAKHERKKAMATIKISEIKEEVPSKVPENKNNPNDTHSGLDDSSMSDEIIKGAGKKDAKRSSHSIPVSSSSRNFAVGNHPDVFSKHSSQLQIKPRNFRVFKSIASIKEHKPKNFYLFFCGILCELVLVFSYFGIVQTSEKDYVELKYNPTKQGMINFCSLYSAFTFAEAIAVEFEYSFLKLKETSPVFNETVQYLRILQQSFLTSKSIIYSERNSPQVLNYQSIYRTYMTNIIIFDSNPKTIKEVSFFELLDFYLSYLKDFEQMERQNYERQNYDFMIFMQINVPYFLIPSAAVFSEIQNSFIKSNDEFSESLLIILIMFLLVMVMVKLFEIFQLTFLHNYMIKILGIFLRTSAREAMKELVFIDHSLEEMKRRSEDYFYTNIASKAIERKLNFQPLETVKMHQPGVKNFESKAKKFKNNRNIKSLAQTGNFFFFVSTMTLSLSYYFFNYYYWLIVNNDIKDLISINISFASIYVYTSTLLICNNNLLRERIIGNESGYDNLGAEYQNYSSRVNFFIEAINQRMPIVLDVAQQELPTQIFKAANYVKDPKFHQLTSNDICDLLLEIEKIQQDEAILCKNMWNNALKKGILICLGHFLEEIQQLGSLRNESNNTQQQIQYIKAYIQDPTHVDLFMGNYFMNLGLSQLNEYLNNYYDYIIESSIYTLKLLLIVTSVILFLINLVISLFIRLNFQKSITILGTSLFLLPNEKVTEDEATMQIINRFLK